MPAKPEVILGLGRRFWESRIFLTAAELDVFTQLSKKPMSAQELADTLNVTLRGITILLDALATMGLLEKKEEKYF
jgi:predicted transcriptional regulator